MLKAAERNQIYRGVRRYITSIQVHRLRVSTKKIGLTSKAIARTTTMKCWDKCRVQQFPIVIMKK